MHKLTWQSLDSSFDRVPGLALQDSHQIIVLLILSYYIK